MSFDVEALAERKHRETGHSAAEWSQAFEIARFPLSFIGLDDQTLNHIAGASRAPSKFTSMIRLIYHHAKTKPQGNGISELLLDITNESPFSLADWIDAIDYFYGWLLARERKIDFLSMLKYLQCCVASPDANEGRQTLATVVKDMLDVHGYVGSSNG